MSTNGIAKNEVLKIVLAGCLAYAPHDKKLLGQNPASKAQIAEYLGKWVSQPTKYRFIQEMIAAHVLVQCEEGKFVIDKTRLREYCESRVVFRACFAIVDYYTDLFAHPFKTLNKVENPALMFEKEYEKWKELKWLKAK